MILTRARTKYRRRVAPLFFMTPDQHINTSTHQHINTSTHQHINKRQQTNKPSPRKTTTVIVVIVVIVVEGLI
jgi:hypothetical protein